MESFYLDSFHSGNLLHHWYWGECFRCFTASSFALSGDPQPALLFIINILALELTLHLCTRGPWHLQTAVLAFHKINPQFNTLSRQHALTVPWQLWCEHLCKARRGKFIQHNSSTRWFKVLYIEHKSIENKFYKRVKGTLQWKLRTNVFQFS